jgi:excisionase family DNA binding protein
MNETLTPIEAGLYLNLHVRTIHRLAKNGLIPALKVGRRWRFKKAALEAWLWGGKTTPGKNEATI